MKTNSRNHSGEYYECSNNSCQEKYQGVNIKENK
jgi:hypothetical protein